MLKLSCKKICALALMSSMLATPALATAMNAAIAPVAAMYRDFAWQAMSSDDKVFGDVLTNRSARALSRYFEPRLASMIANDAACQRHNQSFCKLDFDMLFDTQDPRVVDLSITAGPANKVMVTFKDAVTDKQTLITYMVIRHANGWRIRDANYQGVARKSLRATLSAP